MYGPTPVSAYSVQPIGARGTIEGWIIKQVDWYIIFQYAILLIKLDSANVPHFSPVGLIGNIPDDQHWGPIVTKLYLLFIYSLCTKL